ncbi:MAG: fatty acid CoA ligase family protein [Nannocystaceae bacterium]|nr:fatty acid CoA ligase family protein [bacterium]
MRLNVAAWLPVRAREQPDALAVAVARKGAGGRTEYDELTAAQLEARSNKIAHGLTRVGITRGVRTVLMVTPSPEFFALTFALLKVGAVPVLVDPGMGVKNLGTCLAEAEPEAFIGIPKAHVARFALGWARKSVRIKVMVGPRLPGGGVTLSRLEQDSPDAPFEPIEPEPEEMAAILFTSGSTGVPKGVITPHRVFANQVRLLQESFGIEPGERDLATFPLFALFGPALGMASVVPIMDASRPAEADPRDLLTAMEDYGCTNMFASPALIDKLGRHCQAEDAPLTSLRRAISAGAPASIPSLERIAPHLPEGAQVFTPYGATESLPVAVIGSDTILAETRQRTEAGEGVCVGAPVRSMEVAIIPISDDAIADWADVEPLPAGEIGEIVVKGPVVTPGYYARASSTALAKIRDGEAIRHRMGDVGYLDAQGRLWMCGRKAHRVQTSQGPLFTVPCEAIFNTLPEVRRTALVGLGAPGSARPAICVELAAGADWASVQPKLRALAAEHAVTAGIETFLHHRGSFPVDVRHNSKIFREKLAAWAARAA